MRLSDIMSAMNLAVYAEWALAIFLVVFGAIVVKVALMSRQAEEERARIPLESDPVTPRASDDNSGSKTSGER